MAQVQREPTPLTLRAVLARGLSPYLAALERMAKESARVALYRGGRGRAPAVGAKGEAVADLASLIAETKAVADMVGRLDVIRSADRIVRAIGTRVVRSAGATAPPGAPPPPGSATAPAAGGGEFGGLPRVAFHEAVADIIVREPRLAASAAEVAQAYGTEHAFALARSADLEITRRVQDAIAKALQVGSPLGDAAEVVAEVGDFSRAYAETVVRTNVATAYSAGRFRQMADPAVRNVIGALRFTAVGDADTRHNHAAADGLIASPDDPVWQHLAPPLGFRCRCGLDFVDWIELRRRGMVLPDGTVRRAAIPAGAGPDRGFDHRGRPDVALYLGGS